MKFRQTPYPEYNAARFGMEVLSKHLISTLPSYLSQETPEFLVNLIRNCTAIDPAARPSFDDICDALVAA